MQFLKFPQLHLIGKWYSPISGSIQIIFFKPGCENCVEVPEISTYTKEIQIKNSYHWMMRNEQQAALHCHMPTQKCKQLSFRRSTITSKYANSHEVMGFLIFP